MNALNATEPYTSKWLKLCVLYYVYFILKKVMFTVRVTKQCCELKDRKIKLTNIIQNMDLIWNHVKIPSKPMNYCTSYQTSTNPWSLQREWHHSDVMCWPKAQLYPTALFQEATPALTPPLFTLPVPARMRTWMGQKMTEKSWKLGQRFICVAQISFFNDLLEHPQRLQTEVQAP